MSIILIGVLRIETYLEYSKTVICEEVYVKNGVLPLPSANSFPEHQNDIRRDPINPRHTCPELQRFDKSSGVPQTSTPGEGLNIRS